MYDSGFWQESMGEARGSWSRLGGRDITVHLGRARQYLRIYE